MRSSHPTNDASPRHRATKIRFDVLFAHDLQVMAEVESHAHIAAIDLPRQPHGIVNGFHVEVRVGIRPQEGNG